MERASPCFSSRIVVSPSSARPSRRRGIERVSPLSAVERLIWTEGESQGGSQKVIGGIGLGEELWSIIRGDLVAPSCKILTGRVELPCLPIRCPGCLIPRGALPRCDRPRLWQQVASIVPVYVYPSTICRQAGVSLGGVGRFPVFPVKSVGIWPLGIWGSPSSGE